MIGWELGGRRPGAARVVRLADRIIGRRLYPRPVQRADRTGAGPGDPLVVDDHPDLAGFLHVGAEPIAKYDLLVALREALDIDIEVSANADRGHRSQLGREHVLGR